MRIASVVKNGPSVHSDYTNCTHGQLTCSAGRRRCAPIRAAVHAVEDEVAKHARPATARARVRARVPVPVRGRTQALAATARHAGVRAMRRVDDFDGGRTARDAREIRCVLDLGSILREVRARAEQGNDR
jgi:hypothetical protein